MSNPLDIRNVFVVGSGPIVIGQGCEFDYSGTQALRALRSEGVRVVLLNSNPATIMTDPELADATYIEPITFSSCASILEKERCDAILPTLGGQTALNIAFDLAKSGLLDKLGVRMIGVSLEAILRAEDRRCFKRLVEQAGYDTPRSIVVKSLDEAMEAIEKLKLPLIIRPSFTLGGKGSGMVRDIDHFTELVREGLRKSPVREVLIEESVENWKEFELEVMRDVSGNHVVVCSIENVDPMGTHTGDSITVAPVQTLSDRQFQRMRDAAFTIMDKVEICGGANVQFALDPTSERMMVIEMNPRVSRSSALASKAAGYPIAKVAARLALGLTLDELTNDVVGAISCACEPVLDYCVVKLPRWNFDKFRDANRVLTSQMKSIGEVMAIGRTFNEALQKALRSAESGWAGLVDMTGGEKIHLWPDDAWQSTLKKHQLGALAQRLSYPNPERLFAVKEAFRRGMDSIIVNGLTGIDIWFLENMRKIVELELELEQKGPYCKKETMKRAKEMGFSDSQLAEIWKVKEEDVERKRRGMGVVPVVKTVDTCAGEFEAVTPYYYLSYDDDCESRASDRPKVVILGSGPNRVGQGIEFDYCCVHAAQALSDAAFETIMINCNPETVSTDFDVSTRLYFEPVDYEHVCEVIGKEDPQGVIVQFGGQTPLKILRRLHEAGVKILGTQVEAVDLAEDRKRCSSLLKKLGLKHPECAFARGRTEAAIKAKELGYPVLIRPPYVLGGAAMALTFSEEELLSIVGQALLVSEGRPLMIDKFIEGALEVDVDAVCDGENVVIAGCMEHVEEAGIHSGDSTCTYPAVTLEEEIQLRIEEATKRIALELPVLGMINVQYAVKDDEVFCLEVNPRASRTVPFISKATGISWVKVATRALVGEKIPKELFHNKPPEFFSVKAPVLPFDRFPEIDPLLGPEMFSTGEVMGMGDSFGEALIKAQIAAGVRIPDKGKVFVSVANRHKRQVVFPAWRLSELGFKLMATKGTAGVLKAHGIPVEIVPKISSSNAGVVELIEKSEIDLVVNTIYDRKSIEDGRAIRLAASRMRIPNVNTMAGFNALVLGLSFMRKKPRTKSLQTRFAACPDFSLV